MTSVFITAIALMAQGPDQNPPAGLVERLGTDRHAEAEATLLRLGARALPPLRKAAAGGDKRVRPRASELIDRIERALLSEPTLVTLDYRDRPLEEVVWSLGQRSRMRVFLDPTGMDRRRAMRVTLQEPGPVPFWKAIDGLANAAGLQYNLIPPKEHGDPETRLRFYDGGRLAEESPRYVGPFRIHVHRIRYHDEARLVRGPGGKVRREGHPKVDLHVMLRGEPRLRIGQDDQPRRVEILDDRGRPVVKDDFPGEEKPLDWGFTELAMVPELSINCWGYELAAPATDGARLKSMKATVRIAVEAQRPDPLAIPLEGAKGRTFRQGPLAVEVLDVRPGPEPPPAIDLAAKLDGGRPFPRLMAPVNSWVYWAGGRVEVLDAHGERMAWAARFVPKMPSDPASTIQISPQDRGERPVEIRHRGLMRTIIEVPIELTDIPILER